MPTNDIRLGAPVLELSVDSTATVPALTTLTFSACDKTPLEGTLFNDPNQPLLATDTYQVVVGLVGRDTTNGGYTVNRCSPSSGSLAVSADGNGIQVVVANGAWPSDFDKAACLALFLKINAANFQLAGFAYVSDTDDLVTMIPAKPLRVAPKFTLALLQSTTTDDILGNRVGLGYTWSTLPLTTGNFVFRMLASQVNISPNNSQDFSVSLGRSTSITFSSLINNIKELTRASAGLFFTHTQGLYTYEQSMNSLNTAVAFFRENRPVRVTLPPDRKGNQEIVLLLGLQTVNTDNLEMAWGKAADTPVNFSFQAASLDKLINNMHAELHIIRKLT